MCYNKPVTREKVEIFDKKLYHLQNGVFYAEEKKMGEFVSNSQYDFDIDASGIGTGSRNRKR